MTESLLKTEFEEKEINLANLMAFVTDSVLIFNEVKKVFEIVPKNQISKIYEEALRKGNVLKAKEILDSAEKTVHIDIEKEAKEIVSKSVRVSNEDYIKIVERALKKGTAVSDIVRSLICTQLQKVLDEISLFDGIDKKKLTIIKSLVDEWANKKPSKLKEKESYRKSQGYFYLPDFDSLFFVLKDHIKGFLRENEIPDNVIEILTSNLVYEKESLEHDGLRLSLSDKNEYDLEAAFHIMFWAGDDQDNTELIRERIRNEIEDGSSIVFKLDKILDFNDDNCFQYGSGLAKFETSLPKFYLNIKDGFKVNRIPIENEGKIKKEILMKILPNELKNFNIEEAKIKALKSLGKGIGEARKITEQMVAYKHYENFSKWIASCLLYDIGSSEVITFSAPKPILQLFDLSGGKISLDKK